MTLSDQCTRQCSFIFHSHNMVCDQQEKRMRTTGFPVMLRKALENKCRPPCTRKNGKGMQERSTLIRVPACRVCPGASLRRYPAETARNASCAAEGKLQLISSPPPKFQKASFVGQVPATKTGAEEVGAREAAWKLLVDGGLRIYTSLWSPPTAVS